MPGLVGIDYLFPERVKKGLNEKNPFKNFKKWPIRPYTSTLKVIFVPRIVHICDMMTLDGQANILEPRNHITTLMSSASALDL
jgi:hypothetical protein